MIGASAAMADSPEQAVTDLLIPGGVEGTDMDDFEMIGENKGYKDYQSSPAAKDKDQQNQSLRRLALQNIK